MDSMYADETITESGSAGYVGFRQEYFGARSVIVPRDQKASALDLDWMDFFGRLSDKPWLEGDNTLHGASAFEQEDVKGSLPALIQYIDVERSHDLRVNDDILLALGLKRVEDAWVRPEDDYVEVVRLIRDHDSQPVRLEIKAEFLKDYLCAFNSGLILLTYRSRKAVGERFDELRTHSDKATAPSSSYEWKGSSREVFEGNSVLDILGQAVVSHAWRTDTDYEEDIPVYELPGATASETFEVKSPNRRVNQVIGELWKNEWIEPGGTSPRVRGDKVSSQLEFIVDNEGRRETSDTLDGPSRWLWFHPDVINALLSKPNGVLSWYSEDTGNVGGAWNRSVHFGVNTVGLINVFAKDIGLLREIDKKTWSHYNVSPEGKVSVELLMSQMETNPAATEAAETVFFRLLEQIQEVSRAKFGRELLKHHSASKEISKKIHRFEASSLEGFYSLCKEITRFLIERIDIDLLKELKTETDPKLGSLKRLERILTAMGYDGRNMLSVLVGVYELRVADAHLPSTSGIKDAMALVGVDYDDLKLNAGRRLLQDINTTLIQIKEAFENGDLRRL